MFVKKSFLASMKSVLTRVSMKRRVSRKDAKTLSAVGDPHASVTQKARAGSNILLSRIEKDNITRAWTQGSNKAWTRGRAVRVRVWTRGLASSEPSATGS